MSGTAVCIVGCHRSGTSMVARFVNAAGVPILGEVLEPNEHNKDGYFEEKRLVEFNDRLLGLYATGGRDVWAEELSITDNWRRVPQSMWDEAELFADRDGTWLWKDPRLCLTLPFWRQVLSLRVVAVVVYRNQAEVVASLKRIYDGISDERLEAVWVRYNREIPRSVSGLPVMVTSFHSVVTTPYSFAHDLRRFLLSQGVDAVVPSCVAEWVDESVSVKPTVERQEIDIIHAIRAIR